MCFRLRPSEQVISVFPLCRMVITRRRREKKAKRKNPYQVERMSRKYNKNWFENFFFLFCVALVFVMAVFFPISRSAFFRGRAKKSFDRVRQIRWEESEDNGANSGCVSSTKLWIALGSDRAESIRVTRKFFLAINKWSTRSAAFFSLRARCWHCCIHFIAYWFCIKTKFIDSNIQIAYENKTKTPNDTQRPRKAHTICVHLTLELCASALSPRKKRDVIAACVQSSTRPSEFMTESLSPRSSMIFCSTIFP